MVVLSRRVPCDTPATLVSTSAPAGTDPAGSAVPSETDTGSLAGPLREQHTQAHPIRVTAAH